MNRYKERSLGDVIVLHVCGCELNKAVLSAAQVGADRCGVTIEFPFKGEIRVVR